MSKDTVFLRLAKLGYSTIEIDYKLYEIIRKDGSKLPNLYNGIMSLNKFCDDMEKRLK